jgi:hypothetical protein
MKGYDQNCAFCRLMRSLAYAGVGMGIGSIMAYWFGASKENRMISGIIVAAIIVFGLLNKKNESS